MVKISELEDREDIANLLNGGYTVHIDITLRAHPEDETDISQYHVVTVRDPRNHNKTVSKGEGWLFLEAMIDAYASTPAR